MKDLMKYWSDLIIDQHDKVCNQKYDEDLPYSIHLKFVVAQATKFKHLVDKDLKVYVLMAAMAHDIIEDGRWTYNDVINQASRAMSFHTEHLTGEQIQEKAIFIADMVYAVTDEKGKNRQERKSDKYYKELSENKWAVFIKLADLCANRLYSKLTNNSMYEKYREEFPEFVEKVQINEFEEMYKYLEKI